MTKQKKTRKVPKIGIVVQARMTSKRFPGKSMAMLAGKPVLQHVLERAKQIKNVPGCEKNRVIVAVPDTDDSDPMLVLARDLKVDNFCGPEDDVLKRYYDAAVFFKFDVIMRITADCPLVNPVICNELLDLFLWRNLDYASNIFPTRSYPAGLDCEVMSFDALEAAHIKAVAPYDREHVTPWLQREEAVRKALLSQRVDRSEDNWCVDYPADIQRIETVMQLIKEKKKRVLH